MSEREIYTDDSTLAYKYNIQLFPSYKGFKEKNTL